jgi:hypothetical protein
MPGSHGSCPALKRLRQEDHEFKTSLGEREREKRKRRRRRRRKGKEGGREGGREKRKKKEGKVPVVDISRHL